MLRPAVVADLAQLAAIRDGAGDDALSDPALATDAMLRRLVAADAVTVWGEAGVIAGFAAIDGDAIHLLVDAAQRSRGVGRVLLAAACAGIKDAGHPEARVALAAGGSAERHYRAAGWGDFGRSTTGGVVLKKPL